MAGVDNFVRSKVGRTKCARRAEARDGFCQPAQCAGMHKCRKRRTRKSDRP